MASHQQKLGWWGDRICGIGRIDVMFMGRWPVRIQPEMKAAVEALEEALIDNGYELPIDATGSYSCRKISGSNTWSLHAVPIAIDVDYPNNPVLPYALEPGFGTDPNITITEAQVNAVAEIVNEDGDPIWKWLGWRTPKADPMHFEIDVPPDKCQPADDGGFPVTEERLREIIREETERALGGKPIVMPDGKRTGNQGIVNSVLWAVTNDSTIWEQIWRASNSGDAD